MSQKHSYSPRQHSWPSPSLTLRVFIAGAVSGLIGGTLLTTIFISNAAALSEQLMTAALLIPLGTALGFGFAFIAIILSRFSAPLH